MEKVKVVKETCIGCGACSSIAPDVFEMLDDGLAQVIDGVDFEGMSQDAEKDVMDAMDGCPTEAIEFVLKKR